MSSTAATLRHRIRQEILLGMGGVRALQAMGIEPTVYHLNEGHSAFMAIERIRQAIEREGLTLEEALEERAGELALHDPHARCRRGTTSSRVELMREHFAPLCARLNVPLESLLQLGRVESGERERAVLA